MSVELAVLVIASAGIAASIHAKYLYWRKAARVAASDRASRR